MWRKGLFERRCEDMEEDQMQSEQNWKSAAPDKLDKIAPEKWIQKEGRKALGDWLRDQTISWKARRRLLQTNAGTFPCEARLKKRGKHPDGIC